MPGTEEKSKNGASSEKPKPTPTQEKPADKSKQRGKIDLLCTGDSVTLIGMIPTHSSDKTNRGEVIVNRLSTLSDYDFSEPHRHNYFEFFCFLEGGGHHIIDFREVPIESNSIHIVAPGQVHQVNRAP